jgi:hypothetical protein
VFSSPSRVAEMASREWNNLSARSLSFFFIDLFHSTTRLQFCTASNKSSPGTK